MVLGNCAEASQDLAGAKNELPLILPNFKQTIGRLLYRILHRFLFVLWKECFFVPVTAVTFKNPLLIK